MPRTFHVTRELVRREVVLCEAEDNDEACVKAGLGGGEMIDSTEEGKILNVEETPHSRRRRGVKADTTQKFSELLLSGDEGAQGDAMLASGVTILDSGEGHRKQYVAEIEHAFGASAENVQHIVKTYSEDDLTGGWRTMRPGEAPEAGDEYRLREGHPWEPVTHTLIGHTISAMARAQFRTRRS
jgi:hypothetical protein